MWKILLALTTLVLLGCENKDSSVPTTYDPTLTMMEAMTFVLGPAADVIWSSSGWEITMEGERDLWPQTEEDWNQLIHASAVIIESGNVLKIPGRLHGVDGRGEDWVAYSQAITDTGKQLLKASQERDKQAILDLGGQLYNICTACHTHYLERESE